MNYKLIRKYVPVKITYINSRKREVTVYGAFSSPTIRIGEKRYFRQISDPSKLVQSLKDGQSSKIVGTIIEFVYLDMGEQEYED